MRINFTSFRFRIIITLIVVVSLFSSAAIYLYNQVIFNKIYSDNESSIENILYFLRNEIIDVHDGRLIKPILQDIEKETNHVHLYLMDKHGSITYPRNEVVHPEDTLNFSKLKKRDEDIQVMTTQTDYNPSTLAVLKVRNHPSCHACHSPQESILGYVALNIHNSESNSSLIYARIFSISYTIFIILVILGFVIILHVRFIRRSLSSFQETISSVNEGDLDGRVTIRKASELSVLARSFNRMLDNFQQATLELERYHQNELDSAEKLAAVGEMAARLAHDIRNPLTGISNSIEIIAGDIEDEQHKQVLGEIRRQTTRVNDAITNLLKYAKSTELTMKRGDINELIGNMVFFLKSQKQNSDVRFLLNTDPAIPAFDFDPEQMENVLMNLCYNAIQAMEKKGVLELNTSLQDKYVFITIADTGPGIPEQLKEDVFKPFYTTRTEGTGLGLSIAKEMIKKHCGKIWFENKESGGTVFYIRMPARIMDEA